MFILKKTINNICISICTPPKSSNSSSISLPIFNAFQMDINNSNANSLKFNDSTTKSFNFGEKILTHYIKNNLANTDPYSDPNTLKWYPWLGAISSTTSHASDYASYTEQLYSRLISVVYLIILLFMLQDQIKLKMLINKDTYSEYSSPEAKLLTFV